MVTWAAGGVNSYVIVEVITFFTSFLTNHLCIICHFLLWRPLTVALLCPVRWVVDNGSIEKLVLLFYCPFAIPYPRWNRAPGTDSWYYVIQRGQRRDG